MKASSSVRLISTVLELIDAAHYTVLLLHSRKVGIDL